MGETIKTLFYFNVSGFGVVYVDGYSPKSITELYDSISEEWKYLLLLRRVISYPMIFKTLTDHCREDTWYSRIYFYELRDKPIEMVFRVLDTKTVLLINSRPEPKKLLRRIIANPRYSTTILMLSKVKYEELPASKEWIHRLTRLARKLYLELSPLIFSREMGRLTALKIREVGETVDIEICVTREGVSTSFEHGGLSVSIKPLDQCLM